ncbi:hypothetical protein [Acidiferrobacter thiooxydans]|uniref:hypothetical protein n=1 Tax=Acidiferrobacter thiooxydans TaxID=163359 RepID=UPI0011C028C5|nr:hypothetical protein [Acidiferrobacter thiooxydans]
MTTRSLPPWATGPGEILKHGLDLLKKDTDTNRRLAMISIDNSVELMIKTYLGLPKRINGLAIPRKEYQEISDSFPALLDGLEKHAESKLDGVDLGSIEWYHRLRNELYHKGNGLTVEREKVEIYAELANILFTNLFGCPLVQQVSPKSGVVGQFMVSWLSVERRLRELADRHSATGFRPAGMIEVLRFLNDASLLTNGEMDQLYVLRQIRNQVVHGAVDPEDVLTPDVIDKIRKLAEQFAER